MLSPRWIPPRGPWMLDNTQEILLTDTVGFIRSCPIIWWKRLRVRWRKQGMLISSSM